MTISQHATTFAGLPVRPYNPEDSTAAPQPCVYRLGGLEDADDEINFPDLLDRFLAAHGGKELTALVIGAWDYEDMLNGGRGLPTWSRHWWRTAAACPTSAPCSVARVPGTSKAQGNLEPLAFFNVHVLVQLPGPGGQPMLYDPSYGQTYNDIKDFDDRAVAFYGRESQVNPRETDPNKMVHGFAMRPNPASFDLERDANLSHYWDG